MPSSVGQSIKLSVFGQSHGPAIGCVIEGLPAGFTIDTEALSRFMARRSPGKNAWSSTRREADVVQILSGLNALGQTCGAPLALIIENTNTRSGDYEEIARIPRPGHADWVAHVKWLGANDVAGGGHFSARLTAPLCAAGAICMQFLEARDIRIAAHLAEVAGIADTPFNAYDNSNDAQAALAKQIDFLASHTGFPVLNEEAGVAMQAAIDEARMDTDSVGGIVECVATGMPVGVGSPMFCGIENLFARSLFAIPAVKGVEFGRGFEVARMRGSENNDPYEIDDSGSIRVSTNNAGGALGGISTGAPILFRIAMKPTSSIAAEQASVDLTNNEPATLEVHGRHDPCIAPRAVPVAEAVCAITLLDALESYPAQTS